MRAKEFINEITDEEYMKWFAQQNPGYDAVEDNDDDSGPWPAEDDNPNTSYDEWDRQLSGRDVAYVAQLVFNQKYPGTRIFWIEEDFVGLSTSKRNAGKVWGMYEGAPANHTPNQYTTGMTLDKKGGKRTIIKLAGYSNELKDYIWLVDDDGTQVEIPERELQGEHSAQNPIDVDDDTSDYYVPANAGDYEDDEDDEDDEDYYLSISLYSDEEHDLVIGWADAGAYKGVTTPILKATFDLADKKFGKKKRVLVIDDDRSNGVWKKIAQQLGVEYVNQ